MSEEIWKEIPGYSDYQISNLGRVKSFKRKKQRILKQSKHRYGYLYVTLCRESMMKTFAVHTLMGITFFGFPENTDVDHKNGVPSDNTLENLRWCSRGEIRRNTGVDFHKARGKYRARIKINNKNTHLGFFERPEEAGIAYRDANLKLFGKFSPFNCRDEFKALSDRVEDSLEGAV